MHRRLESTSSALLGFTQGFVVTSRPVSILHCLAPAASRLSSRRESTSTGWRCHRARRCASTTSAHGARSAVPPAESLQGERRVGPSGVTLSPRDRDANAWAALLDPYLPLELRSKSWLENLAQFEGVRSVEALPALLAEAQRAQSLKQNLLSYIGLSQGRWLALLWLIKAMLASRRPGLAILGNPSLHRPTYVPPMPLDDFTRYPSPSGEARVHEPCGPLSLTLDQITDSHTKWWQGKPVSARPDLVGQIWECVGHLILEAVDRGPEHSVDIMSHVLLIIAYMHRHGAVPNSLYNYKPAKDPSALRRPPTLHLLSSRILALLSDSMWKAHEKEIIAEAAQVGAKYVYKGHELPGAEFTPRLRPLRPEIWLELVLWACVEEGQINEAARIVHHMAQRKGEASWSVIGWPAVQKASGYGQSEDAAVDWDRARTRYVGVAGACEGYSEDPPFVDMGSRTASSEVIEAVIDGLINTTSSSVEARASVPASVLLRSLNSCKKLLRRGSSDLESISWNSVMLRVVESADFNPDITPRILDTILDLAPLYRKEDASSGDLEGLGTAELKAIMLESAASVGILHQTLRAYIRLDNINSALRTFKKLQNLINPVRAKTMPDRTRSVLEFPTKSQDPPPRSGSMGLDQLDRQIDEATRAYPPIPLPILAEFLDLIRRTKLFHIGRWLLSAEENIDPVIQPYLYASSHLQPALLRFATATADGKLLYEVTQQLRTPLPIETIRALLHCQLVLGKWDAAEDLLEYIKAERAIALSASDVMTVAQTFLRTEGSQGEDESIEESAIRARSILHNMLSGAYNKRPDPSQPPDYSQVRLLNQISRILASVPGGVAAVAASFVHPEGQAHATTNIPVDAFNILLEGVVDRYGARAGKELWDIWCQSPSPDLSVPQEEVSENVPASAEVQIAPIGQEKVVSPSLQTVRIILDPIVNRREKEPTKDGAEDKEPSVPEGRLGRYGPRADYETLAWGVAMYRQFGLTDREIERDVPGNFG